MAETKGRREPKKSWVLTAAAAVLLAGATAFASGLGQRFADTLGSGHPDLLSYSSSAIESRCLGGEFVPRSSLSSALAVASVQDWQGIEVQPGAAPVAPGVVQLSVQGESTRKVTLTGITFTVKRHRRPPGAIFSGQCGGPFVGRAIEVDLDRHPPRVVDSVADEKGMLGSRGLHGERLYRQIKFPWTVSVTDPLLVEVIAKTDSCYCEWSAKIPWVSGARTGTIHIDDGGSPFVLTAASGLPAYVPAPSGWRRFKSY